MDKITKVFLSGELSALYIYPEESSEQYKHEVQEFMAYLRLKNPGKHLTSETKNYEKTKSM